MKLKNTIGFTISLCLFTLLVFGCQEMRNQKISSPDDTLISVFRDDAKQDDIIYQGAVFIGDATDEDFGNDPYYLNAATITDDTLKVNVTFSGGCRNHEFTLIAADLEVARDQRQADIENGVVLTVAIAHNANGDTCEAAPTEDWHFDLTSIKTVYQKVYQQKAGTIILRLKDAPDGELVYKFTM